MSDVNWKTKTLIIGGVVGAFIGLGTAFLFTRSAEKSSTLEEGIPEISTGEALGIAISIIGIIRGIAALGDVKNK